jgi:hypothetical protein
VVADAGRLVTPREGDVELSLSLSEHSRSALCAYYLGALTEPERAAADVHLDACDECRHELARLDGYRSDLQTYDPFG